MTPRTIVKPLTKNQKYEKAKKDAGLVKATVWCPEGCLDELKELMSIINEFHLEKGEFHKDLFPAMYREFSTGKMGNKSLLETKAKAAKEVKS